MFTSLTKDQLNTMMKWLLFGLITLTVFHLGSAFADANPLGGGTGSTNLQNVAGNATKGFEASTSAIGGAGLVLGICLIIFGIYDLKRIAHTGSQTGKGPGLAITCLIAGALIVFAPTLIDITGSQFLGSGAKSDWSLINGNSAATNN